MLFTLVWLCALSTSFAGAEQYISDYVCTSAGSVNQWLSSQGCSVGLVLFSSGFARVRWMWCWQMQETCDSAQLPILMNGDVWQAQRHVWLACDCLHVKANFYAYSNSDIFPSRASSATQTSSLTGVMTGHRHSSKRSSRCDLCISSRCAKGLKGIVKGVLLSSHQTLAFLCSSLPPLSLSLCPSWCPVPFQAAVQHFLESVRKTAGNSSPEASLLAVHVADDPQ